MGTQAGANAGAVMDEAEFRALYAELRDARRWGPKDRRGALNTITPAQVLDAAHEVRAGRHVSMASPIETEPGPDNPEPGRHEMTSPTGTALAGSGVDFALDRFTMNVHGNADTHLDALSHVVFDDALYNGVGCETLTPEGATALSVDVDRHGIVGRGVLLDIPRLRGVRWLEPGDHVTADDLAAAEDVQQVGVGSGDLLFVRVGHRLRRRELGAWDAAHSRAGLHPAAVRYVAEREVALLGSDGNNDTAPSLVTGVDFPVHVLAVNALGVQLLDYLQFEDLVPLCEGERRWTFLCVVAPLRLPEATGSPVNPVALL
ncbi:MAG: cyclase family protein [Actinomycetes bacterium]